MVAVFQQGGWVMWPLLALSILGLGVFFERAMFYGGLGFPSEKQENALNAALASRDATALDAVFSSAHPLFAHYFDELRKFLREGENKNHVQSQEILNIFAQEIVNRLDNHLPLLGVIIRAAPLLGLLGTVIGMINTFSRLAAAQGGVDLMLLADGIWQALLTTAAGLIIAIPLLLVQYAFISRKRRVIDSLDRCATAVFALAAGENGHAV